MDWQAVILTLKLAFWTTFSLLIIGMPLAYWLANSKWRGKVFIQAIVGLPIILPPTVLGFYVLMATGPLSPIGKFWENMTGNTMPFSFAGILVGSILYNLPFAVRPFEAAFSSVDRRLVEASWSLGVSKFKTFLRTEIPLSWAGILAGSILCFVHTVGEFGVVLMVGGNIPGATRTLSILIYDDVQALNYRSANLTALMLMAFSFITLCGIFALPKKVRTL